MKFTVLLSLVWIPVKIAVDLCQVVNGLALHANVSICITHIYGCMCVLDSLENKMGCPINSWYYSNNFYFQAYLFSAFVFFE